MKFFIFSFFLSSIFFVFIFTTFSPPDFSPVVGKKIKESRAIVLSPKFFPPREKKGNPIKEKKKIDLSRSSVPDKIESVEVDISDFKTPPPTSNYLKKVIAEAKRQKEMIKSKIEEEDCDPSRFVSLMTTFLALLKTEQKKKSKDNIDEAEALVLKKVKRIYYYEPINLLNFFSQKELDSLVSSFSVRELSSDV